MMRDITDLRLRVYAVWVPKLSAQEKDVPVATRLMSDGRATHYWDEGGMLVRAYTQALSLPEDALDIYFLYGPDARWEAEVPPKPHFWMHQLGSRDEPRVAGPYWMPQCLLTAHGCCSAGDRSPATATQLPTDYSTTRQPACT